ncbi:hypothetical protein D3C79_286830 [compost metagenome]
MSEKMRYGFEEWLNESGQLTMREDDGEYSFQHTRFAWMAWQASRAALVVELPENCKGMALTVDELRSMLDKIGVTLK